MQKTKNITGNTMLYLPGRISFYCQGLVLTLNSGVSYPIEEQKEYLQAVGYSAGGQIYVSTKGIARASFPLSFRKLAGADYEALVDWFDNVSQGALNPFRLLDGQGRGPQVRLLSNPLDLKEEKEGLYSGRVLLVEELP